MIRTVFILCVVKSILCIEHDFKGFDDSILFGINWPGSPESIENLVTGEVNISEAPKKEVVNVVTSNKEKYECHIPELRAKETARIEKYDGPSPVTFLNTLFDKKICAYRLESYWSYELCHGRYIKQYHEEREGKQIKTQEYYLGHWNSEKHAKLEADLKRNQELKSYRKVKVEGAILPSIEMVMDDGTVCDLSGKPRLTRVLYVCYIHGKHEVYSFKETSTCEYEIIILSPFLCEHPHFKPKDDSENIIDCVPVGDSPKKPRSLLKMEADSLKFQHMKSIKMISAENNPKDILAVLKVEKIDKDGETHLKFEIHPLMEDEDMTQGSKSTQSPSHALINTDDSPVRAFLNGENCLHGGTGWWKYEFCYGKHVVQYHVDRAGEKTTLLLGKFDEEEHINWIKENKGKAPKPVEQRTSVSHFYSNGDVCDKTGKPRQTEVKLKCLENSSSPAQVSLYLLEPRTCHYILGVETPLICDILPLADDNGLIKSAKPVLLKVTSTEGNTADQVKVEEEIPEHFGND